MKPRESDSPSANDISRPPLSRVLTVVLVVFLILFAMVATFAAAIRGPHISNLELFLGSAGYAAFIEGAYFAGVWMFQRCQDKYAQK